MTLELFATDWRELWTGAEAREPVGAIFTKPEIVELILDVAGYEPASRRLAESPLLEPSCGDGAFLTVAVRRLIESERIHRGVVDWRDTHLAAAIRAADISLESVKTARRLVVTAVREAGCPKPEAIALAEQWVLQTDFLLSDWPHQFEFVIGNPPYVRIEDVPKRVLMRYREIFSTTTDRADLYVAFFERGLELLSANGTLAFICANRFTKNKYGAALRRLLAERYRVRQYINLEHTQPFLSDVSAYPAIVVIDRKKGEPTRAATLDDIKPETLTTVRREALARRHPNVIVSEFRSWYPAGEPWLTTSGAEHGRLDQWNATLPTLENSAAETKVGIGVATGADDVFVLKEKCCDIEESRQIPLLMSANIGNTELCWSGRYLVNPFSDENNGSLVDLKDFPGLSAHLESHAEQLRGRHVAKSRPRNWYRTIDRIWPSLQERPKLMIPDIQSATVIGYDRGAYYPHHNLYWITSATWPLRALKALLRSSIVYEQVRAYSVQMRGGSVRFQAQTLRRVRVPLLRDLSDHLVSRLEAAAESGDQGLIDSLAGEAFGTALGR